MNDKEFRAFMDLLMCSDPWPVDDKDNQAIMISLADKEAKKRRFEGWITAYHMFGEAASHVKVFDNGGKTYDRYTVIIGYDVFTMSPNPSSPQGINQYSGPVQLIDLETSSRLGVHLPQIPKELEAAIEARQKELAGGS